MSMAMRSDQVLWTQEAERVFFAMSPSLQHQAITTVRHALATYRSQLEWHRGREALKGVDRPVYEFRLTQRVGGLRALVCDHDHHLTLVALADHPDVARFSRTYQRRHDFQKLLDEAEPVPAIFNTAQQPVFVEIDGEAQPVWAEELDEDAWLWFLSDEQLDLVGYLEQRILDADEEDRAYHGRLLAGAGTGKTIVLLNLASRLYAKGWTVIFGCTEPMTRYIRAFYGIDVAQLATGDRGGGAVILVDDPGNSNVAREATRLAERNSVHIILGCDPLQWPAKDLDTTLASLPEAEALTLTTSYRQASNLTTSVIQTMTGLNERFSWRKDPPRVRAEQSRRAELLDDYLGHLRLVKPGGRTRVFEGASCRTAVELYAHEHRDRWDRWTKLPSMLVVEDRKHGVKTPAPAKRALTGVNRLTCDLADPRGVRGMEFQSVWLFLSKQYWRWLQDGDLGLGRQDFDEICLIHVPLTRAKDELLVFVWN